MRASGKRAVDGLASPTQLKGGHEPLENAGHAKVPAEVPEDSRVLRVRCLWFPTSNCLDTWLIPSGTTRSRQYIV